MAFASAIKLGQTIQMLEALEPTDDPINLLMVAAYQHALTVKFRDLLEEPSQKTFICKVEIGSLLDECIGYGPTKKDAKVNAAEEAISKLTENVNDSNPLLESPQEPQLLSETQQELPSPSKATAMVTSQLDRLSNHNSTFPRSLSSPEGTKSVSSMSNNPIGALQELTTLRGWPAPQYELTQEYGEPHRKTFVMECKIKNTISQGKGSTKKCAKKEAAEEMLKLVQGSGIFLKRNFSEPGFEQGDFLHSSSTNKATRATTSVHGKESSALSLFEKMKIGPPRQKNPFYDKLKKQASINNWDVKFRDLEKGYSGNYLCFVKVSSVPVTVCAGSGPTREHAHDVAAENALMVIREPFMQNHKICHEKSNRKDSNRNI